MQNQDRINSNLAYDNEVKYHGEHVVNMWAGTKDEYYKYIWKQGAAKEFSDFLDKPTPDWQQDC